MVRVEIKERKIKGDRLLKYEHGLLVCPYCNRQAVIFDPDSNEYVCTHCGAVIEDHVIDHGFEYRLLDSHMVLGRTSGSFTNRTHDNGIGGTTFGRISVYSSPTNKKKWSDIKRLQKSIRVEKKNKIVEKALRHLNDYIRILRPPKYVAETAGQILRKAVEGKNYKDKTLKNMAIASIFLAYKVHGIPRSAKVFAKEVGVTLRELWHAEKRIHDNVKDINKMIKRDDPSNYIPYLVHKLNLSEKVRYLALYLVNLSKKAGLTNGKSAIGLATAAVYVASILLNEKRTQIEVASAVNVTDVTIRNRYSDIVENFDITISL